VIAPRLHAKVAGRPVVAETATTGGVTACIRSSAGILGRMPLTRKKTPTRQFRDALVDPALSVLGRDHGRSKDKAGLSGVRALATGAALYTAGRAAFKSRRFLREQFSWSQAADAETTGVREEDEPDGRSPEEEAEAAGRHDEDAGERGDGSSAETATPPPKRKPVRARQERPQPSIELPQQRWPRIGAARR
jgi:hypothetical protein